MIGVIGATGMVGAAVAERLHSAGLPILLGGRRRSSINHPTHADIEITQVDITDSVSLDAFCRSCSIVVHCAGPSYRILDTVARTALSNGAHYVDPAGDDPVYTRLERPPGPQKAAVVSAGLLPGVSAMLLSWLADRLDEPVHRLSCLAGGIAPLSVAAAADFLLSEEAGMGQPLADWSNHQRRTAALRPIRQVNLPFFPGSVSAFPYLPTELERICHRYRVPEARWFNIFPAGQAEQVIATLGPIPDTGLDDAVAQLRSAVAHDMLGQAPYHRIVMQAATNAGDVHTVVLSCEDGYQVTAFVTSTVAALVHSDQIPNGVYRAEEILDPSEIITSLHGLQGVSVIEIGPSLELIDPTQAQTSTHEEEGEL